MNGGSAGQRALPECRVAMVWPRGQRVYYHAQRVSCHNQIHPSLLSKLISPQGEEPCPVLCAWCDYRGKLNLSTPRVQFREAES